MNLWNEWALVSLGSNQGDSLGLLCQALEGLQRYSRQPLVRSSWWKSQPVDCPPESPWFLNAVAALLPEPQLSPEALLQGLQALETSLGRGPRIHKNEPRTIDLDLIAFGREQRCQPDLVLPHPRAHLRRFVLAPLCELAPGYCLPGFSVSVSVLLSRLGQEQQLHRLDI